MATIAHLANFYGPRSGGLRTSMLHLAREYQLLGHQAHLVVPGSTDGERGVEGVRIHEVASPRVPRTGGYRVICRLGAVRRILEEVQTDAIELSDRTTLLPIAGWARAQGIPVTSIVHERLDGVLRAYAPRLPSTAIADCWNQALARRVDRIVATTEFAAAEIERIGVMVCRVPLGVDAQEFTPGKAVPDWHERLGADLVLVLASRLSKEKQPAFALEVLRAVMARGIGVHLLVLGDGPLLPSLQGKATGLPVTFLGFVSQRSALASILASADVALAPGPIETFGLAALEAMASGTPVVVNEDSALREVIGDSGGVALPLDAEQWAAGVFDLWRNPRAGERARQRAGHFSWTAAAHRMLEVSRLRAEVGAVAT